MTDTWTFRQGDPVPEWLLSVEPDTPGGPRPSVTFISDTTVVATSGSFWLLPTGRPESQYGIKFEGNYAGDTTATAGSLPLSVPIKSLCMYPLGEQVGGQTVDFTGRTFPPS